MVQYSAVRKTPWFSRSISKSIVKFVFVTHANNSGLIVLPHQGMGIMSPIKKRYFFMFSEKSRASYIAGIAKIVLYHNV